VFRHKFFILQFIFFILSLSFSSFSFSVSFFSLSFCIFSSYFFHSSSFSPSFSLQFLSLSLSLSSVSVFSVYFLDSVSLVFFIPLNVVLQCCYFCTGLFELFQYLFSVSSVLVNLRQSLS
jgi:hypothetical protein